MPAECRPRERAGVAKGAAGRIETTDCPSAAAGNQKTAGLVPGRRSPGEKETGAADEPRRPRRRPARRPAAGLNSCAGDKADGHG